MRNTGLEKLDGLVGTWTMNLSDAPFLPPGTEVPGTATVEWLGEAFPIMRMEFDEGGTTSETTVVFGRSDANDAYVALYHDERGVCREFAMTFEHGHWTMLREDPDFHQRFVADVEQDRILGRWEASEDEGKTWRKDFDLTFVRA
ncbi:hypothetical protein BJF79_00940 [Actinomadura sp. CNU-125]|uniref:hypothetical protein n=1 Tax=Actinomadura sp. CNU-125 TaxID=1904961 RepID=UPI00095B5174|nr:hypothetical protein [Actinomadura sp. CNU-125]OLT31768.1 hypothetical protein BJF79_00940 [Actinomadura sp. CNU-125]